MSGLLKHIFSHPKSFKNNVIKRTPKKERADVLLVYPIWVTAGGRGRLQRMLPPLGILSIASYLEQNGFEVHIVDLHAEKISPEDYRKIVRSLKPRFVGITVLSSHYVPANYVATITKEEIDDVKVFVGGVHAEAYPEQMLQNPYIDAVGRGDGEEIMLELVNNVPFCDVLGLSYRRNDGRVVHNPPRPVEMDLDKYPFPSYHLIDFDLYFPAVGTYRDLPAINALMTRGCPGKCTFCNSANTVLRGRSVDKMVELIKKLRYEYGIRQINFYDDTFTADVKNVRRFCQQIIDQKIDIKFVCYVRGDMLSESMAQLLSKAGCHHLLLGIESGSKTLREKIKKPIKEEIYFRAVKIAHKYGMEVRGAFIIGHLEETKETLKETLQFAIDLDVDFFQPSIMTPYPGTQLFKQAKLDDLLKHENYELYGQGLPVLKMKYLTEKELMRFQTYSFYRFYFRPRAIWQQIKRLRNWYQFVDLFKAFYIILMDGISELKNDHLQEWLNFDIEKIRDNSIITPHEPKLTWEVRQEMVLTKVK